LKYPNTNLKARSGRLKFQMIRVEDENSDDSPCSTHQELVKDFD